MKACEKTICFLLLVMSLLPVGGVAADAEQDETVWNTALREQFFPGKKLQQGESVISLDAPYRAEDPALVPIKVSAGFEQTEQRYIKRLALFVDKNPVPFVGEFEFTPVSGKADIALRVRINTYSYVRAVAELNDGSMYMTKRFVKASGGCSAPLGADLDAAMQRLGKMKFRLDEGVKLNEPALVQLLISHPNVTGMQMDQVSRLVKPAHFVKQVKVFFNDQPVLIAKTDIAVSADPNFRFYFVPEQAGELRAEITDSEGKSFTASFPLNL
ncbi:MAG: quinoprotein dehydrogenase-associated SoxYZ-like carrier [Gammaproteobacteria bacterium]